MATPLFVRFLFFGGNSGTKPTEAVKRKQLAVGGIQMLMFSRVNMSVFKQVVLLTLVLSVASTPLKKRDEKVGEKSS